jgi:hypothetical protein
MKLYKLGPSRIQTHDHIIARKCNATATHRPGEDLFIIGICYRQTHVCRYVSRRGETYASLLYVAYTKAIFEPVIFCFCYVHCYTVFYFQFEGQWFMIRHYPMAIIQKRDCVQSTFTLEGYGM